MTVEGVKYILFTEEIPDISNCHGDALEVGVIFDDAAGVDEAKQELEEVIEFLKEPSKFTELGGRMPKGVLLVGPPVRGRRF